MKDRQLICELCDWFGLDNLYPYTDNEKILNEFKKVLEHKEDIHLALLTASKKLKEQDKILDILKPYLKKTLHIEERSSGFVMSIEPVTFYISQVMDLDFNFNDTEKIKNIRKIKDWLNE